MDDDDFMAQSHEYVDMAGMLPTLGSFMMLDKKSPAEKHHSLPDEEMVQLYAGHGRHHHHMHRHPHRELGLQYNALLVTADDLDGGDVTIYQAEQVQADADKQIAEAEKAQGEAQYDDAALEHSGTFDEGGALAAALAAKQAAFADKKDELGAAADVLEKPKKKSEKYGNGPMSAGKDDETTTKGKPIPAKKPVVKKKEPTPAEKAAAAADRKSVV